MSLTLKKRNKTAKEKKEYELAKKELKSNNKPIVKEAVNTKD